MDFGIKEMGTIVAALGFKAFVLGIVAERKKPASGTPTFSGEVVTCKYPSDPTVYLGFLSILSLAAAMVIGFYAVLHPYKGKSVPLIALFRSTKFSVFFSITVWLSLFAQVMLLWTTITELKHLTSNVHHNLNTTCPTAKTGLFGGGAFLALDASLFWLLSLMLVDNVREDYFDEEENDNNEFGEVLTTEYAARGQGNFA